MNDNIITLVTGVPLEKSLVDNRIEALQDVISILAEASEKADFLDLPEWAENIDYLIGNMTDEMLILDNGEEGEDYE